MRNLVIYANPNDKRYKRYKLYPSLYRIQIFDFNKYRDRIKRIFKTFDVVGLNKENDFVEIYVYDSFDIDYVFVKLLRIGFNEPDLKGATPRPVFLFKLVGLNYDDLDEHLFSGVDLTIINPKTNEFRQYIGKNQSLNVL